MYSTCDAEESGRQARKSNALRKRMLGGGGYGVRQAGGGSLSLAARSRGTSGGGETADPGGARHVT